MGKNFTEIKNGQNNQQQYGDSINWKCYGTQRLRKMKNKDSYSGLCKHECRFKDECISRSREEPEFVERQLMQVPLDVGKQSRMDDIYDEDGELKRVEYIYDDDSEISAREADTILETLTDEGIQNNKAALLFCQKLGVIDELRPAFIEYITRSAFLREQSPKIYACLMDSIIKNLNQTEQAKMRRITKQAFNKGLMTEAMRMRMPDGLPEELEGLEKAVYSLLIEGLSTREICKRLKISKGTQYRVGQLIHSKIGNIGAVKKSLRKKTRKKRRTNNQILRDSQKSVKQQLEQLKRLKKELAKKI